VDGLEFGLGAGFGGGFVLVGGEEEGFFFVVFLGLRLFVQVFELFGFGGAAVSVCVCV
jgi:hypothetical protein